MPLNFIKGLFDGDPKEEKAQKAQKAGDIKAEKKKKVDGEARPPKEVLKQKETLKKVKEKKQQKDGEQLKNLRKPAKQGLAPAKGPVKKSKTLMEIEQIMEEDLEKAYIKLSPELQKEFREKGEDTAWKIEIVLMKVKVKAQEIFELIRKWLKIIPGINRFFLEQEAKIKTDQIMALKNKNK